MTGRGPGRLLAGYTIDLVETLTASSRLSKIIVAVIVLAAVVRIRDQRWGDLYDGLVVPLSMWIGYLYGRADAAVRDE